MTVLVLTPETIKAIENLKQYAAEHFYTWEQMQKIVAGELPPAGDEFYICIPLSYKVVYTIEQHNKSEESVGGAVWCEHISISCGSKDFPLPRSVGEILALFKMPSIETILNTGAIYLENEHNPGLKAVNLVVPLKDFKA